MKRKTIEELVYIRAIAAFGIFMIHLSGSFALFSLYGSKAMHLGIFANQFFRFGTPIFMIVSGFVLFFNYRNFEEFDYMKFCTKKVKYILIPYILWSAFYYLLPRYRAISTMTSNNILEFMKIIALGNAYPHLYFIFLIFQFYLLYPLFLKLFIKVMEKKPLHFYFICLFIQSTILIYEFYFKTYGEGGALNFFNKFFWKTVFGWFYYFFTGGLIALHYNKITAFIEKNIAKIIPIYIISTILYLGEVYLDLWNANGRTNYERYGSIRPTTMVYATVTMVILIWIGRKIAGGNLKYKQIIRTCGVYSLGIYFAHPFVLEFIKAKLINGFPTFLGYSRISTLVLLVVIGWVCTVVSILLLSKIKWGIFIIGKVPQYQIPFIENIRSRNQDRTV